MVFLISLILAFMLAWLGAKAIKKHANLFCIVSIVLSLSVIVISYAGLNRSFPVWVQSYIWPIFANCAFATALFVVVMMMGALPNGSAAIKRLMPIRAELSIIACILTLGHNIGYGKTYFVMLFTTPERLSGALLWAAICSLVLIAIMLPLMITSFPAVRKKMKPKSWKRLQRMAYVFYGLIYVHVMLLNSTFLAGGQTKYLFNIFLYTVVFAVYAAMRIRKAMLKKNPSTAKIAPALPAAAAVIVLALVCVPSLAPKKPAVSAADETTEAPAAPDTTDAEGKYKSGTYNGTGTGFSGNITLAVTVSETMIESIQVVESDEDEPFWSSALALVETILSAQSTEVDTITGATFSSNGIIEAVNQALSEASGVTPETETAPVTETDPVTEAETAPAPETESAPAPETEPAPAPETEPAPAPETEPAPAPETEPAPAPETEPAPTPVTEPAPAPETESAPAPETEPAPAPETEPAPAPETEPAAQYTDGVYFGNGTGYNGNIQVAVMITDGSISSVIVVSTSDDQAFWSKALEVVDSVIDAQNTEVDTITGATFSSKGLLEAIADALSQAQN
ncbi:MAG: FMN-binding protein [Clostridia bacterium]|nr:FMN-binding protein [Clostridia bacterium]